MRMQLQLGLALVVALILPHTVLGTSIFVSTAFDRSGWEASVSGVTTDTFSNDIANAASINFDTGINSTGFNPINTPNNLVDSSIGVTGRYSGTFRTVNATNTGYLSIVWTFPNPVMAFAADFFSIGGSRQGSVQGDFGSGLESFDLRALFIADGGLDQGFFGLVGTSPFSQITLISTAPVFAGNDAFTVDNASFATTAMPEPGTVVLTGAALIALLGRGLAGRVRSRRKQQRKLIRAQV
ncbi:MAG: hypothetical protein GY953_55920 [bacterium]|nr:hypothetical protein [bacterium]